MAASRTGLQGFHRLCERVGWIVIVSVHKNLVLFLSLKHTQCLSLFASF